MASKKFDLRNPIFHDAAAAREYLEAVLWPQDPVCPRCGVMGDRITKLQGKSTRPGVYNCKDCRKPFSVTVGTVMERSHIPLSKWLLAGRLMASSKKSMSAHQLHRMMDVTYEAAWFLFHRLREASVEMEPSPLGGENKVVEADETYIGGKARNKAFGPPPKKAAVLTVVERAVYGQFHHVSEAHLHRYLAEADFKYNHRAALGVDDPERTAALLRGAKGKRLYYREPNETPNA